MTKEAFTVQEAAEATGVSADVIKSHIKHGNLVARYPSRRPIIPAEELRNWLEHLPTEYTA